MIYIRKRDGRIEPFNKEKIIATCLKAGGNYEICKVIAEEISRKFSGVIPSDFLLEYVKSRLRKLGLYEASIRYPLKKALYELDGKEFEWYVSRLLELEGYDVRKEESIIVRGKCIEHEIDILAQKDKKTYIIECKHHVDLQILTDLTAVMKHYARYLDIKHNFVDPVPMVVTNTKFTPHAIRYSNCVGIKLLGWNTPYDNGINAMIERHKAYPLSLFNINKHLRDLLRQKHILTTLDLFDRWEDASKLLPPNILRRVNKKLNIIYK